MAARAAGTLRRAARRLTRTHAHSTSHRSLTGYRRGRAREPLPWRAHRVPERRSARRRPISQRHADLAELSEPFAQETQGAGSDLQAAYSAVPAGMDCTSTPSWTGTRATWPRWADHCYLIGHDLGGLVALTLAALAPGLVRSVSAVSMSRPRPPATAENLTPAHPPSPLEMVGVPALALNACLRAPPHRRYRC